MLLINLVVGCSYFHCNSYSIFQLFKFWNSSHNLLLNQRFLTVCQRGWIPRVSHHQLHSSTFKCHKIDESFDELRFIGCSHCSTMWLSDAVACTVSVYTVQLSITDTVHWPVATSQRYCTKSTAPVSHSSSCLCSPHIQCESKNSSLPLKLFAIFSFVVKVCNMKSFSVVAQHISTRLPVLVNISEYSYAL